MSSTQKVDGIGALNGKREERRSRGAMLPPPQRGRALTAAPPLPSPSDPQEAPPEPQEATQATISPTEAPARQPARRTPPPPPTRTVEPPEKNVRATTLSMPKDILVRFNAARAGEGSRTADVILNAIAAAHSRSEGNLAELVMARRPELETGGLFPGRVAEQARQSGESQTAGDTAPVYVRLVGAHMDVIDDLVKEVEKVRQAQRPAEAAVTRSELIAAALDDHLPLAPRRRRR